MLEIASSSWIVGTDRARRTVRRKMPHGGVVIVRPDGYIGFAADIDDADAVKEYLTLLR